MGFKKGEPRLPNAGRKVGDSNLLTRDIREMILGALSAGGGQHWLEQQMGDNPVAFMGLVGKIIPQQIDATIRRELPMMTREDIVALLESVRGRVIEHQPELSADRVSDPSLPGGVANAKARSRQAWQAGETVNNKHKLPPRLPDQGDKSQPIVKKRKRAVDPNLR